MTPFASQSRTRRAGVMLVVSLISSLGLGIVAPSTGADAVPAAGAVTKTKTVQRTFTDATGKTTVVGRNRVALTVAQTSGLRSLQLTTVSWSGAHPTGGIVPDQNSDLAQNEEYSMALFECRGVDSAAHPLSPKTCWTQYADERFDYGYNDSPYPAWRSDSAATAAERAADVNRPSGAALTDDCKNLLFGSTYERWVPFVGADKHNYPGGLFGCAGQPAEASPANLSGNLALPSNETYGVTDSSGNGSTNFDVFTAEDHASLGCSSTVACSLVAVPIVGVSCDPAGTKLPAGQRPTGGDVDTATASCESRGSFAPGQTLPAQGRGSAAVDGSLWWSPSNWANRIAVPLGFAPADNVCSLTSAGKTVDVYGSEVLAQATTSWAPYFCLNPKLFNLNHVQTPEPQARNLLEQGNIEAAYTSDPPAAPYPGPTVNAPVAVSGFGIAATIDGTDGRPVASVKLDARLLAKLLSESYPAVLGVQINDPPLSNNPLNITHDPEFQALNPNIPQTSTQAAATLLTVSSDSDVTYAMTSYINADPEARAWLDGKPDPWGMVVNPKYKKIALPVTNWPLLDTFQVPNVQGVNDCLYANPTAFLPLVAAPTARLFSIAQDMQFALAQSQTTCVLPSPIPGSTDGAKLVANGRQAGGHHFMLGVVSLGDAGRSGLTLSALQTHSTASPAARITDAQGRTFVTPDPAGLRAAAKTLRPDTATGTWQVPYAALRSSSTNAGAYPGTMVVYAAIPTKGLPAGDGKRYSQFLQFAAGRGQHPGVAQGDLPLGYLPMTSANDLGALAAYTLRAATAVAAQRGATPSLVPLRGGGTRSESHSGSSSGSSTTGSNSAGGAQNASVGGGTVGPTSAAKSSIPATRPTTSSSAPGTLAASPVSARTPRFGSTAAGALPVLLGLAIMMMLAALIVRLRANGRRGA